MLTTKSYRHEDEYEVDEDGHVSEIVCEDEGNECDNKHDDEN